MVRDLVRIRLLRTICFPMVWPLQPQVPKLLIMMIKIMTMMMLLLLLLLYLSNNNKRLSEARYLNLTGLNTLSVPAVSFWIPSAVHWDFVCVLYHASDNYCVSMEENPAVFSLQTSVSFSMSVLNCFTLTCYGVCCVLNLIFHCCFLC